MDYRRRLRGLLGGLSRSEWYCLSGCPGGAESVEIRVEQGLLLGLVFGEVGLGCGLDLPFGEVGCGLDLPFGEVGCGLVVLGAQFCLCALDGAGAVG